MEFIQYIAAGFCKWVLWFALLFILFDIVTGYAQAIANRCIDSSKMRKGFWHKLAIIIVLIVANVIDAGLNMGFNAGNMGISAPIFEVACGYVVVMELTSILENVKLMNPELADTKLLRLFNAHDSGDEPKVD